jgi:RTX calcium-binding nonapeptide repeat (4 copies)
MTQPRRSPAPPGPTSATSPRRRHRIAGPVVTAGLLMAGLAGGAAAVVEPGTPAKDVTAGLDNDNAANTFIQPPGVTAPQHMDNTDLLFGRDNDDLLIGNLGGDTLLGGADDDILIGGPERYTTPSSDVIVGEEGDDIDVWAPGDGNDAFAGNEDKDTMVLAPFVLDANGRLVLTHVHGRKIPHVDIDAQPTFTCAVEPVPDSEHLGFQFLVRFYDDGTLVATVRQKDVEKVYCPSPTPGTAQVARLGSAHPTAFRTVHLDGIRGAVGDILAPVG